MWHATGRSYSDASSASDGAHGDASEYSHEGVQDVHGDVYASRQTDTVSSCTEHPTETNESGDPIANDSAETNRAASTQAVDEPLAGEASADALAASASLPAPQHSSALPQHPLASQQNSPAPMSAIPSSSFAPLHSSSAMPIPAPSVPEGRRKSRPRLFSRHQVDRKTEKGPSSPRSVAKETPVKGKSSFRGMKSMSLSFQLASIVILVVALAECILGAAVRQLVQQYILEKTDTQLSQQAQLVFDNYKQLVSNGPGQHNYSPTDYFLQIRDTDGNVLSTMQPMLRNGIVSEPDLDTVDQSSIEYGTPFTVAASVTVPSGVQTTSKELTSAGRNWRVEAFQIVETGARGSSAGPSDSSASSDGSNSDSSSTDSSDGTVIGVAYIGMSLRDMYDTTNMVTQYFLIAGICTLLAAGILAAMFVRNTLMPLKKMEKTAAKIAAGDLSERVPQLPASTEVGSLALSLNKMLAQIERSFNEQEQTTEKMKQFVSDASHELRTPLATIHGYAELYKMQRKAEPDDLPSALEHADDAIDHIETSSERMSALVEDLLALARFDEGRGIDTSQAVQLDELIRESAEDLHALDPERMVHLGGVSVAKQKADGASGTASDTAKGMGETPDDATDADSQQQAGEWSFVANDDTLGAVQMSGDPMRLHQVLTNIIGNIHRYTPADSPVEFGACIVKSPYSKDLAQLPSTQESLRGFIESLAVTPQGADAVDDGTGVESAAADATVYSLRDIEVTAGDGHDDQSLFGKVPAGAARQATRQQSDGKRTRKQQAVALPERNYVLAVVNDHGPGMRPDQRARIFERFYTADPSRARLKGGTGLGMSIVQSVVHAHHGLICATQTPGGGLSYSIVIPVDAVAPQEALNAPSA